MTEYEQQGGMLVPVFPTANDCPGGTQSGRAGAISSGAGEVASGAALTFVAALAAVGVAGYFLLR